MFFSKKKIIRISAKTFAKHCVRNIIDKEKMLWLRNKDIGENLSVGNIYDLIDKEVKGKFETKNPTDEQIREYKRHGSELIDDEKFMYTREDIIISIIMHCRATNENVIDFRTGLRFKQHYITVKKRQSVAKKIIKLLPNEKILPQHFVLSSQVDLYFYTFLSIN